MTEDQAAAILAAALQEVAPEADLAAVDAAQPLGEALGIDSRDFLTLVAAIERRAGIGISPGDYPRLATVGSLVSYLTSAVSGR